MGKRQFSIEKNTSENKIFSFFLGIVDGGKITNHKLHKCNFCCNNFYIKILGSRRKQIIVSAIFILIGLGLGVYLGHELYTNHMESGNLVFKEQNWLFLLYWYFICLDWNEECCSRIEVFLQGEAFNHQNAYAGKAKQKSSERVTHKWWFWES